LELVSSMSATGTARRLWARKESIRLVVSDRDEPGLDIAPVGKIGIGPQGSEEGF
jgi:hypothetical protein